MKKSIPYLTLTAVLFFSACTSKHHITPLSPTEYEHHEIVFEVQYDTTCDTDPAKRVMGTTHSYPLTKGQRFVPKDVSGKEFMNSVLPEHSIALPVSIYKNAAVDMWSYIIIYPDGNFVSSYHMGMIYYGLEHKTQEMIPTTEICNVIDSKPIFKSIQREK